MTLVRRGEEYVIRVDGQDLMGSRQHGSEEALAKLGCAALAQAAGARVLIGGLGMGFTMRAALDALPKDARVDVAELVPAVVRWNRGPLAHLADRPLDDRRGHVIEGDVTQVIARAVNTYDAILLDVDNGPDALTSPTNARLYGSAGLASAARALKARGLFGVWSARDDSRFTARLTRAGFVPRVEQVPARHGGKKRHVLWLSLKRG